MGFRDKPIDAFADWNNFVLFYFVATFLFTCSFNKVIQYFITKKCQASKQQQMQLLNQLSMPTKNCLGSFHVCILIKKKQIMVFFVKVLHKFLSYPSISNKDNEIGGHIYHKSHL